MELPDGIVDCSCVSGNDTFKVETIDGSGGAVMRTTRFPLHPSLSGQHAVPSCPSPPLLLPSVCVKNYCALLYQLLGWYSVITCTGITEAYVNKDSTGFRILLILVVIVIITPIKQAGTPQEE